MNLPVPRPASCIRYSSSGAARLLLLLVCASSAVAAPPARDPDTADAERVLSAAGVALDGPSVLAYVQTHTLSGADLQYLARTVKALGAPDYASREEASRALVAAGPAARPYLRRAARAPDLEVARRARACLDELNASPIPSRLMAAAQLLKDRRPPGSAAALLAYLPCIDDEVLEDAWYDALRAVGTPDGRPDPSLPAALADEHPARRAAAAHVLSRSSSAPTRRLVSPLLKDDDARVRYEAAAGLFRAGDKAAAAVLLALLTDAPLPVAARAEYVLSLSSDRAGPGLRDGKPAARRRCRDDWEEWWKSHGDAVDLSRLRQESLPLGRTVVCEYDGSGRFGRVWEWGPGGQARWQLTGLAGPNDVQVLSGGRVLVAERNANRVTERDRQGNVLWEHRTEGNPIACQRLPDGHTLIATFREVCEVTPDQTKVRVHRDRRDYRHALKLPDGRLLYVTRNGVLVELDADWQRELRTIPLPADFAAGATFWASVEPLPGGRYLLALGGAGHVVEVDAAGKILWECKVPSPVFATRLRNGHTLVSCFEERCVIEVDRDGTEVGKQTLNGRPFVVRRY